MRDYGWAPYVSVAQRRANARKQMEKLKKKGLAVQPVETGGRKIAASFWGKGWCDHMESFSDYANRLPRGRTYVRNGSVCHLAIESGQIKAIVSGSTLYNVRITITPLAKNRWAAVKRACSGKIASLIDLLRGKLDKGTMEVVSDRKEGLFPLPGEMKFACDCPDWADMCKHVAAVLYGVGTRLDDSPEMLFLLRGVKHEELVDVTAAVSEAGQKGSSRRRIAATGIADVFGIDLAEAKVVPQPPARGAQKSTPKRAAKAENQGTLHENPFPEPLTGNVIRAWRSDLNETQSQFAARLKISTSSISQWEAKGGKRLCMQRRTLAALHKAWKLTTHCS
ncbi:MAG: hypothetical protein RQ724_06075 [Desulfuromonadales bacterium]|nr:hypothetical protein [Desulfuromonadales bacterium]